MKQTKNSTKRQNERLLVQINIVMKSLWNYDGVDLSHPIERAFNKYPSIQRMKKKRRENKIITFRWYLWNYPKVYIECYSLLSSFKIILNVANASLEVFI